MKNKSMMAVVTALFFFLTVLTAQAEQLAFPGAEGFGRFASGGRGGTVYYVTSLADCPDNALVEGTLRWALKTGDTSEPRTVLFNVAGTIHLTSVLKCSTKNVSILGQRALGGGICIADHEFKLNGAENVIIRYLRFRKGDNSNESAFGVENSKNVIIDHCSFSWSSEENVTMYDNDSTTLQWTISSEALYNSVNTKGARSYGGQWGGEHSSFHHNLFAHCLKRVPQVYGVSSGDSDPTTHDFFVDQEMYNNVVYNSNGSGENAYNGRLHAPNVSTAYLNVNMAKNYYVSGPATYQSGGKQYIMTIYNQNSGSDACTGISKWYIEGNEQQINSYCQYSTTNLNNLAIDNWLNASNTGSNPRFVNFKIALTANTSIGGTGLYTDYKADVPSVNSGIETTTAELAYRAVLANAGARLPLMDKVDTRVINEAAGNVAPIYHGDLVPTWLGIIDSLNDLKPEGAGDEWTAWPDLSAEGDMTPIVDTDGDGMPDEYEDANGFDKLDASDGAAIASSGYSNLEEYQNSVVTWIPAVVQETAARSGKKVRLGLYDLQGRRLGAEPNGIPYVKDGELLMKQTR